MTLTSDHKAKIASSLSKETPELVSQIRELRDHFSLRQLAKEVGIGYATLCRIIKKHDMTLSKTGKMRAAEATRQAHVGKIPWNKGGELSQETKTKIGHAVSGEKNGQYGRGMTENEKN